MCPSDADLFQPSIEPGGRAAAGSGRAPWRLQSIGYASFFGGPLAAGALGWINARRLGSERAARIAIATGLLCFVAAAIGAILYIGSDTAFLAETKTRNARTARLLFRVAGVAAFLIFRRAQVSPDRLYLMNTPVGAETAYASLWIPGFVAVLFGSVAQGLLLVGLTSIL